MDLSSALTIFEESALLVIESAASTMTDPTEGSILVEFPWGGKHE